MRNALLRTAIKIAFLATLTISPLPHTRAEDAAASKLVAIPPDKDTDIKLYAADGSVVTGTDALARMPNADLTLWVAGNQFFAMDEVIGAFRRSEGGLSVGLMTLPPGLIVSAILAGGWVYKGHEYAATPDVYASVNLGHLKQLKAANLMSQYAVYMHNELQILVAKNNPKNVTGINDLVRADVKTSMPNPVNEGIMQFYARKVLERHNVWQQISGGKECVSCQTTANNWFTAVHHRETPARLQDGKSDAGIVWKTEALEAQRLGANLDAVELPPSDSLRDAVSYAIGVLTNSKHRQAADRYLAFVASEAGQAAYAKFGFVNATADELRSKPID
ncbi:MAG: ABC transporter substrate-binding protein [Alphaproteobacteria bacterium]|nr:MAG: ABC transporter substrate-binding protein [Alphaproteobacteria bacterium]